MPRKLALILISPDYSLADFYGIAIWKTWFSNETVLQRRLTRCLQRTVYTLYIAKQNRLGLNQTQFCQIYLLDGKNSNSQENRLPYRDHPLRRWQIFTIFDPYPPPVGSFLLLSVGKFGQFFKVWTFWERHKIWKHLPLKIWRHWVIEIGRFFQILCPSKKFQTLPLA